MRIEWETVKIILEKFEDDSICEYLNNLGILPKGFHDLNAQEQERIKTAIVASRDNALEYIQEGMDSGLISGVTIRKSLEGRKYYGIFRPLITPKGVMLLEILKDKEQWAWIQKEAASKNLTLNLSAILELSKKYQPT